MPVCSAQKWIFRHFVIEILIDSMLYFQYVKT